MASYLGDEWPIQMPDGTEYNGQDLLAFVRAQKSPMAPGWDVNTLMNELHQLLGSPILDIPQVTAGSNHYVSTVCGREASLSDGCLLTHSRLFVGFEGHYCRPGAAASPSRP